jgi:hypothetical protein
MADDAIVSAPGGAMHGTHTGTWLVVGVIVLILLFVLFRGGGSSAAGGIQELGPTQGDVQIAQTQASATSNAISTIAGLIGAENQTSAQLTLGEAQVASQNEQTNDAFNLGEYQTSIENSAQNSALAAQEYIIQLETAAQQAETDANAHAFEEAAKAGYNSQYNNQLLGTVGNGLSGAGSALLGLL